MGRINIAVNRPTPPGRSIAAKILIKRSNYAYCDAGVVYQTITYLALQNQIDIQTEEPSVAPCANHTISFQQTENGQRVFIDDYEMTEAVRQPDVASVVSVVSKYTEVREEMVTLQQKIGQAGGVVMGGRDVGTAVLPEVGTKIFLVASIEERVERHFKRSQEKGIETDFETLKAETKCRGYSDSTREMPPLVQTNGAVEINTAGLMIEKVIAIVQSMIKWEGFELF